MTYEGQVARSLATVKRKGKKIQLLADGLSPSSFDLTVVAVQFSFIERATGMIQPKDYKFIAAAGENPGLVIDPAIHSLYFETAFGDIPAGATLRIIGAPPVAPDGTNIIFEIQARR